MGSPETRKPVPEHGPRKESKTSLHLINNYISSKGDLSRAAVPAGERLDELVGRHRNLDDGFPHRLLNQPTQSTSSVFKETIERIRP